MGQENFLGNGFLENFKITCLVRVWCLSIQNQYQFEKHYCKFQFFQNHFDGHVTPVAGPIFRSLPLRDISTSEFKNQMTSSTLLDIQLTLLFVCGLYSFVPELEHLIEFFFHSLFSNKKPLKSRSCKIVHEMKLR